MVVISAGKYVPIAVVNDPGVTERGKYIDAGLIIWEMQSVSLSTRLSYKWFIETHPKYTCQDLIISKLNILIKMRLCKKKKKKFCYHLLTLKLFQTCLNSCLLLNIKRRFEERGWLKSCWSPLTSIVWKKNTMEVNVRESEHILAGRPSQAMRKSKYKCSG